MSNSSERNFLGRFVDLVGDYDRPLLDILAIAESTNPKLNPIEQDHPLLKGAVPLAENSDKVFIHEETSLLMIQGPNDAYWAVSDSHSARDFAKDISIVAGHFDNYISNRLILKFAKPIIGLIAIRDEGTLARLRSILFDPEKIAVTYQSAAEVIQDQIDLDIELLHTVKQNLQNAQKRQAKVNIIFCQKG